MAWAEDLSGEKAKMRWDPYLLFPESEFDSFWHDHLKKRPRRVLIVMGRGFDPRALEATRRIKVAGATPDIWLLAFDNGLEDSELRAELTTKNHGELISLCGEETIHQVDIKICGGEQGNATSANTKSAIKNAGEIAQYDDVVVDLSAMPRMVALTTVAKLIHELDALDASGGKNINLHVTLAESVTADLMMALGSLHEEVTFVIGFSGHLSAQGTEHVPRVWFPVLGEGQTARLVKIQGKLDPDEICPVIPFPSRIPRRGDEIIDEHHQVLFEDFHIEPRNILRATEYNPFEAYKQLFLAMDRYHRALRKLGGCKAFVSPISSKLLSIGALLACYDHSHGAGPGDHMKVGIPYVETAVYGDPLVGEELEVELYSMWIRGEWER